MNMKINVFFILSFFYVNKFRTKIPDKIIAQIQMFLNGNFFMRHISSLREGLKGKNKKPPADGGFISASCPSKRLRG